MSDSLPSQFTFPQNLSSLPGASQNEGKLSLADQSLLLEQVQQGDMVALQRVLDLKLAAYQARVEDIGLRKEQLQISLSGPEVPLQETLEPLLQTWIVQLGLFKFSAIELYGQKDGSALPFWRCAFNPKDVDLSTLAVIEPPVVASPVGFVDPLQVESKPGSNHAVSEDPWDAPEREGVSTHPVPEVAEPFSSDYLEDAFSLDVEDGVGEATPQTPPLDVAPQEKTKAVKEFLARYAAGERDFAKINLNEADLSRVNLTLANLHEAELIWANLTEANLYHIDLSRAKLRQANLSGAMLRSSNLQGTDFVNANLRGADLSWSNLNGANLTGADLTDANLKNAILERVILPDGTFLD
jgi:Pentapeptide repeats (8 copies)